MEERVGNFFMAWLLDGSKVFSETSTRGRLSFSTFTSFNIMISYLASRCYQNVSVEEQRDLPLQEKTGARITPEKQ